jgi:hypothetical protein
MTCSTYYDLTEQGYGQWWFLWLGLSMGALGTAFFIVARSIYYEQRTWVGTLLKMGSAVFTIGWIGLSIYLTLVGYTTYRKILEMRSAGREQYTQGIVVDFSPYDLSKNSVIESFKVDHRTFSYSPNEIRPGFRQTHAKGSPIQNGTNVRISSIDNLITRLEICQPSP